MYLPTVLLKDLVEIENADKNAALQMQLYKCVDMNKDNPKIEDDDYF